MDVVDKLKIELSISLVLCNTDAAHADFKVTAADVDFQKSFTADDEYKTAVPGASVTLCVGVCKSVGVFLKSKVLTMLVFLLGAMTIACTSKIRDPLSPTSSLAASQA